MVGQCFDSPRSWGAALSLVPALVRVASRRDGAWLHTLSPRLWHPAGRCSECDRRRERGGATRRRAPGSSGKSVGRALGVWPGEPTLCHTDTVTAPCVRPPRKLTVLQGEEPSWASFHVPHSSGHRVMFRLALFIV